MAIKKSKWDGIVVELRKHVPFDPFRLVARDGKKHLIAEPENFVTRGSEYWFPDRQTGGMVRLLKADIVAIEELRPLVVK